MKTYKQDLYRIKPHLSVTQGSSNKDNYREHLNKSLIKILNCLSLADEIRLAYILPSLKTQTRLKIDAQEFETFIWELCQENWKLILYINLAFSNRINSILEMIKNIEIEIYEDHLLTLLALQIAQLTLLKEFILKFISEAIYTIEIKISEINNDIAYLNDVIKIILASKSKALDRIEEIENGKKELFNESIYNRFSDIEVYLPAPHPTGNETYIDYDKMSNYLKDEYKNNGIDSNFDSNSFVRKIAEKEIFSANKHLLIDPDELDNLIKNTINQNAKSLSHLAISLNECVNDFSVKSSILDKLKREEAEKISSIDELLNSVNNILEYKYTEKDCLIELQNNLSEQFQSLDGAASMSELLEKMDICGVKLEESFSLIDSNQLSTSIEINIPNMSIENIDLSAINSIVASIEKNVSLLPEFESDKELKEKNKSPYNSETAKAGFFKPHTNPITDNPAKSPTTDPTKKTQP